MQMDAAGILQAGLAIILLRLMSCGKSQYNIAFFLDSSQGQFNPLTLPPTLELYVYIVCVCGKASSCIIHFMFRATRCSFSLHLFPPYRFIPVVCDNTFACYVCITQITPVLGQTTERITHINIGGFSPINGRYFFNFFIYNRQRLTATNRYHH